MTIRHGIDCVVKRYIQTQTKTTEIRFNHSVTVEMTSLRHRDIIEL